MEVAAATGMKNPEGDGGVVEANFVWILRYAQNGSLFLARILNVGRAELGCGRSSASTPLKPKSGLNGAPAQLLDWSIGKWCKFGEIKEE
jgi:hypothetical protein